KEAHETLYHFHKPETEAQANAWLLRYLLRYNEQQHRSQPHSRQADWVANLPAEGLREMCTWEQFCRLAREPERRKVGIDARVTTSGCSHRPRHQHAPRNPSMRTPWSITSPRRWRRSLPLPTS